MIKTLSSKAVFVLAVAGAAVVGGATTALVAAAIPSSTDGKIYGCYRNNASLTVPKGNLRVVDNEAGQTCTTQESPLNWSQSESKVIAKRTTITFDESNSQTIIKVPEFGSFLIEPGSCTQNNGSPSYIYVNDTSHVVQFTQDAGTNVYLNPGETSGASFSLVQQYPYLLGYEENGKDRVATVVFSGAPDFTNNICTFQAQASISE